MGYLKLVWVFSAVATATGGAVAAPEPPRNTELQTSTVGGHDGSGFPFAPGGFSMGDSMGELDRLQSEMMGGGFLSSLFQRPGGIMSQLGSIMNTSHSGSSMRLLPSPPGSPCKIVVALPGESLPADLSVKLERGSISVSYSHEQTEEVTKRDGSGEGEMFRKTVSTQMSSVGVGVPAACILTVETLKAGFGGWVHGMVGGAPSCTVVLPDREGIKGAGEEGGLGADVVASLENDPVQFVKSADPGTLCMVQGFTPEECKGRVGMVLTVELASDLPGGGTSIPRYDI